MGNPSMKAEQRLNNGAMDSNALPPAAPAAPDYQRWWPRSSYLPAPAALRLPDEEWVTCQGATLHLDRLPRPAARTTVILLHGGGGHGRLLLPFALPLWRAGYEVIAPDLPPFGHSRAAHRRITFDDWVAWTAALVERERRGGARQVALYGLSIGGLTAYHAAAADRRVCAVLATALLDFRDAAVRDAAAKSRFWSRVVAPLGAALPSLFDGLRLRAASVAKLSAMSPDAAFVRALAEDPGIGRARVPASFFRTLAARAPAVEPEAFRDTPVLLAQPEADAWTPLALSQPFFDRLGSPKRLVLLPGGSHAPLQRAAFDELQRAALQLLATVAPLAS